MIVNEVITHTESCGLSDNDSYEQNHDRRILQSQVMSPRFDGTTQLPQRYPAKQMLHKATQHPVIPSLAPRDLARHGALGGRGRKANAESQTSVAELRFYACDLFLDELLKVAAEQEQLQNEEDHEEMLKKIRHIIDRIKGKAASSIGLPTVDNVSPYRGLTLAVTLSPPNRYLSPQDERSWHFDVGERKKESQQRAKRS